MKPRERPSSAASMKGSSSSTTSATGLSISGEAAVLATSDSSATLTNGSALPLVVGMTCLERVLSVALHGEPRGGAFEGGERGSCGGIWTSSGLTDPYGQSLMNKGFFRLLFNGQGLTLGEAAAQAKAATPDQDVRRSWILFGDPTTKLRQ